MRHDRPTPDDGARQRTLFADPPRRAPAPRPLVVGDPVPLAVRGGSGRDGGWTACLQEAGIPVWHCAHRHRVEAGALACAWRERGVCGAPDLDERPRRRRGQAPATAGRERRKGTMRTEDFRLAAHEAAVVGEAAGTALRELSAAALRVLVAHYIDESEAEYYAAHYGGSFDWKRAAGGGARFGTLAVLMGEEAYFALDAEKEAWWRQHYAEADARERARGPLCSRCAHPTGDVPPDAEALDCGPDSSDPTT
jgi:hypothetical protein